VTLKDDNKLPASEAGMLIDVPVEEGQSVEKDEIVAQIDSRSTLAKQNIAKAEWEAAKAQAANNAEIEVAESAIEVSKADLDANDEIRKTNPRAVSAAEARKYKFQYDKSIAQKKQAVNEKDIAGLTANAKKAQHDAASIEIDLRQARSPFRGQVVEILKKKGDWVTAGEPIMHIVGLDQVRVKGFVLVSGPNGASQDDVIGKPVTITVDAAGDKKQTVKGIVRFASPVIEGVGASRQFRIWADVDNEKTVDPVTGQESWKIQPGSRATMTIDLMPPKPLSKSEPVKGKGKVDAYKPVTPEAEKPSARER
jgi:multidrug resistance efflux pump